MSDQKLDCKKIRKIRNKIKQIESKSAGGGYIFRGEPSLHKKKPYSGKVSSSLWREYIAKEEIIAQYVGHVEKQMLSDAKNHSGRRPPRELRHDDPFSWAVEKSLTRKIDFEVLTEIQHYGGKTNLIDFSEDYLVALFFACEKNDDKKGRVILQKKSDLIKRRMIAFPEKPRHRVVVQKSVFVNPPKGYIEKPSPDMVVTIQKRLKKPIREWLKSYHNIYTETIYNDIHGFITNQKIHGDFYINLYKGIAHSNRGDEVDDQENQ